MIGAGLYAYEGENGREEAPTKRNKAGVLVYRTGKHKGQPVPVAAPTPKPVYKTAAEAFAIAKERLQQFDCVGLQEAFYVSIKLCFVMLGWPFNPDLYVKTSNPYFRTDLTARHNTKEGGVPGERDARRTLPWLAMIL